MGPELTIAQSLAELEITAPHLMDIRSGRDRTWRAWDWAMVSLGLRCWSWRRSLPFQLVFFQLALRQSLPAFGHG